MRRGGRICVGLGKHWKAANARKNLQAFMDMLALCKQHSSSWAETLYAGCMCLVLWTFLFRVVLFLAIRLFSLFLFSFRVGFRLLKKRWAAKSAAIPDNAEGHGFPAHTHTLCFVVKLRPGSIVIIYLPISFDRPSASGSGHSKL